MVPGGSEYSVGIGDISGTPGLSVVLVDENQRIASWNEAAADLFGVPAAQALGRPATEVAGQPRTVTGLGREDFARVIAEEGGWYGSLLYQRRDGSEFLLQTTGLRVRLERSAGTLWLTHLPGKDSDQYALGEALAGAAAERRRLMMIAEAGKLFGSSLELEVILDRVVTQTAEALGDCCLIQLLDESGTLLLPSVTHHNDSAQARVFHDMVTHPRRAAEGVSGQALRTGEPILIARYEPAQAGRLSDPYIAEGSLHAGIRSMIFARSDVVHPEVLSLNDIIAGLEQLLRRTLGEHITLDTAPAGGLWPVKADAGQLEQVLVNLAVNARDAMPGGGKLTIDTANITVDDAYAQGRPGLQPGRYARLRVSDSGTGMPAEVLARAFEPFFTTKPARAPGSASPRSTASSPEPAATPGSTPNPGSAPPSPACCPPPAKKRPDPRGRRLRLPAAAARRSCSSKTKPACKNWPPAS